MQSNLRRSIFTSRPRLRAAGLPVGLVSAALLLGLWTAVPGARTVQAQADPGLAFPDVVARIDDYEIRRSELLAQAQVVRLNALQGGGSDPAGSVAFYRQVLEALIGERLMYADLERRGAVASTSQVDAALAHLMEQRGGQDAFMATLEAQRIPLEVIRRQLKQNISIRLLLERDIGTKVRPADEELRRFYDSNLERMWKPERHRVRHILKRVSVMGGEAAKEKAHAELLALRQQVSAGADFTDLARDHSEDAASREQGGELPWIVIVDPEGDAFSKAVAELGTVGQISDVVETPEGLHLIQLMSRDPAVLRTFEQAKAEIAGILTTTRVKQEVLEKVQALRSSAKIEILI